ncbi:hypothetical protein I4F81_008790 [Pyropia yezoensis]|uniref:Uncharacterized protein n=1 Tax=Pyropia yezoensis TaxID=2788 RepID=A0ACC3C8G1_PYRYE|nr:hypothetical protein I4F81_008790 [Neopyropia yezoensis]
MYTSNAKLALGLFHGCIGFITAYQSDGTAVSLTLTEAVLDIEAAFEAGMVHTAVSRVSNSSHVYVKSFNPLRLYADPAVVKLYLKTLVRV